MGLLPGSLSGPVERQLLPEAGLGQLRAVLFKALPMWPWCLVAKAGLWLGTCINKARGVLSC